MDQPASFETRVNDYLRMAGLGLVVFGILKFVPRILGTYQLEHKEQGSTAVVVATWLLAAAMIAGLGYLGYTIYRDGGVPQPGKPVFQVRRINVLQELVMSVGGAGLTFLLAIIVTGIPTMLDPMPYGPKDSAIGNLLLGLFLGLPGIAMLLWRPAYRLDRDARTLVRHKLSSAFPLVTVLPYDFTIESEVHFGPSASGYTREPRAICISGKVTSTGGVFIIEMLPLGTSPTMIELRCARWREELGLPARPVAPDAMLAA